MRCGRGKQMPESSVKITLGVQLDKSEIDKQLQEMQKELDAYKLKIGVNREQLAASDPEQPTDKTSPKSFESPGDEESVDFGVLSDLANEKFNETFGLIDTVNNNLIEILGEVKAIRGAIDGLSPTSTTQKDDDTKASPIESDLNSAIKESEEKITTQLTDIVAVLATISNQLSDKKESLPLVDSGAGQISTDAKPLPRNNQLTDSSSEDISSLVQEGIDKIVAVVNQATDSIDNPFSFLQEIVDVAADAFSDLLSTAKSALESLTTNVVQVVTDLLGEALADIQDSVLKLLENTLRDLVRDILSNFSGGEQKKSSNGDKGGDNLAGNISSGITSLISVIVRLQEILSEQFSQVTGRFLPEIITQLQFDFFKSLIGGAVERLGGALINQSAGGAAKLVEGVITGNVFNNADPAKEATMAFGQGFADSDPTLIASSLKSISAMIESISSTDSPIDIAILEDQVKLINAQLVKVVTALSNCACEEGFKSIVETLGEIARRLDTGDGSATDPRALSKSSPNTENNPPRKLPYGEEINANAPPLLDNTSAIAKDVTSTPVVDTRQEAVLEDSNFDFETFTNNLARIAEDVLNAVGLSISKVIDSGSFPNVKIDEENKLGGSTGYNRQTNSLLVGKETANSLGSSNDIGQKEFIEIARELRKAIQSEFGGKGFSLKEQKAGRGEDLSIGGVLVPILKQKDLMDKSKLPQVKENISDANLKDVDPWARPGVQKGVKALNTDAEVFAQNLADSLFKELENVSSDLPDLVPQKKEQLLLPEGRPDKLPSTSQQVAQQLTKADGGINGKEVVKAIEAGDITGDTGQIVQLLDQSLNIANSSAQSLGDVKENLPTESSSLVTGAISSTTPLIDSKPVEDLINSVSTPVPLSTLPDSAQTDFSPELLLSNFMQIAEKVFSSIGVEIANIVSKGLLPSLTIDTENKFNGQSNYNPKQNQITVSEKTGAALGGSSPIDKEVFIEIAKELRKAIQTAFGATPPYRLAKRAERGADIPLGKSSGTPMMKLSSLADPTKAEDVLSEVNSQMTSSNNLATEKGVRALNIDAEVFAQNLADIAIPNTSNVVGDSTSPETNNIPGTENLFRKSKDSETDLEKPLEQLVQGNEELIVLSRENVQKGRVNIGRLAGDSFMGNKGGSLDGAISSQVDTVIDKTSRLFDAFGNQLKTFALSTGQKLGISTDWIQSIQKVIDNFNVLKTVLSIISPSISQSLDDLGVAALNDSVGLLVKSFVEAQNFVNSFAQGSSPNRNEEDPPSFQEIASKIGTRIEEATGVSLPTDKIIESVKKGSQTAGNYAKAAGQTAIDFLPPSLVSNLVAILQKIDSWGGVLLGTIGQLIASLKNGFATGGTGTNVKNVLSDVAEYINNSSLQAENNTLFRDQESPTPENLGQKTSSSSLDLPSNDLETTVENLIRPIEVPLPEIPDPWNPSPSTPIQGDGSKGNPIQAQLIDPEPLTPPDFSQIPNPLEIPGEWSAIADNSKKKTQLEQDKTTKEKVPDLNNLLQKVLPTAIAGLVVSKLGVSLLNKLIPGGKRVERQVAVNDFQSILTKALVAAVAVAFGQKLFPQIKDILSPNKEAGISDRLKSVFSKKENVSGGQPVDTLETIFSTQIDPRSPVDSLFRDTNKTTENNDAPAIESQKNSDLPKLIAVAIAAVLTKSLLGSVIKSTVTGNTREPSLGEKLFSRVINAIGTGPRRIKEEVGASINNSPLNLGKDNSLLGKTLSTVLNNSLIGVGNKMLGGSPFRVGGEKQATKTNELASPGFFESLFSKLPIIVTGLIIAGLLSQVVPRLLAGNTTGTGTTQPGQQEITQVVGETIDYTKTTENAAAIAEKVLMSSGIDVASLKEQGLMPKIGVDAENKYKGASIYRGKTNEILLGQDTAKGLAQEGNISKESFVTLIHELRHAMQTNFGQTQTSSVVQGYKDGNRQINTQGLVMDLLEVNNLIDKTQAMSVDKQAILSTSGVSTDWYNPIKALEVDAETFAQNLASTVYGNQPEIAIADTLKRAPDPIKDKDIAKYLEAGQESIVDLEKTLVALIKLLKTTPVKQIGTNLTSGVVASNPMINSPVAKSPTILDSSIGSPDKILSPDAPIISPTTIVPDTEQSLQKPIVQAEPEQGKSWQLTLKAIKTSAENMLVVLEKIAIKFLNIGSQKPNLANDSMPSLDALYRQVKQDKAEPNNKNVETDKTGVVKLGERIGNQLVGGIENVQEKINKKMQDSGMNADEIRGLTDQAGAYLFANLSAFFPAGAIGVALAPIAASVSALGIPIAAAVNQLAPIGQMLADTMRTMNPIVTRFETIGGTPEKGKEMMDFAAQIAQQYNTPLLASIEGFSRLTAASKGSKLEGQDTQELFKGVSQAMAALGLNAQDASLIFLAFQQVISKGKVAAEELRGQIGERLPGAIQLAAKSMGMTVKDFSASLDRGEISANILLPKLAKAFQEEYGAGAEAASKSFLGTLNKIENSLFNFRRLMVDEFGGIVAGVASAAAKALDSVIWIIDNILLKSGLMFNAILGIQAQIIAGTAFIFTKLDIATALAKALSGGYGKLSLVLIPFVFGLFQEILGTVAAKAFGIEISGAIEMITGFFSNVVGRVIQSFIDLSKDPKQVMEGFVNILRSISLGLTNVTTAVLNMGIAVRDKFGIATDSLTWFIQKLGTAETLINKIADSSISKIYAPQVESDNNNSGNKSSGIGEEFKSIFNVKAIARASLEFFGLFVIMIQTFVLIRIIGQEFIKMGAAFKIFAADFSKALMSMKTGKSILTMLTLGFSGLNLVLAGLFTLIALMVFKSNTVNSFLSELSNSVKDLEKLNKNLDNLTNKKIDITTRITQLDQEGVRDTPFQDKGLTLSFWRAKDQEQFTSDDVIRMIQDRIDSTAYRRDLPLLPDNFSESRGSMFDQNNLAGLGAVLSSQVGQKSQPTSFDSLISLKENLAKERKDIEDFLILNLQLNTTNTFDELNKLKSELGNVDNQLATIEQKREKLGNRSSIGQVFTSMTNAVAGREAFPSASTSVVETVKLFRDISKYAPGLGAGSSGVSAVPGGVTNLLMGAESLGYTETELRLKQQKAELEAQINALDQQRSLTPGSDTMIGLTPLEQQIDNLTKELQGIDSELSIVQTPVNTPFPSLIPPLPGSSQTAPTPEYAAIEDLARLTRRDELLARRESVSKSLQELQKNIGTSVDDLEKEIKQKSARIAELSVGKTREERMANNKEITPLANEVNLLMAQREAIIAANKREELSRVNQDIRAIQTFANMPGAFNNAFNQDDTVLREMVSQQLNVFSMVQNERINPSRLNEGNLVSVLPGLQSDVQQERDSTLANIQRIEQELAQLDTNSSGAQKKVEALNKELKSLNNRLIGLKGLNRFLDISQTYANLGAGKQELQDTRITRSLNRLSETLKNSPVQSDALRQFQESPTLPNLAQLEQSILIDLVPAQQAVSRAQAERENVLSTPRLRTEKDLRQSGFVTKEQKQQLDIFRALEEKIQRDIQSARKTVTAAYADYNQATAEGLDFQPALENYYAVGEELKNLQTQLEDLRKERDAFLDEVKTIVPPIQVDDKAREQRLGEVDQAIKDAEAKVNELAKQFELIQQTKSGLGGLGQLGENLDIAAAQLREPLKGFAAVWEFATRKREGAAQLMERRSDVLNPALETVGGFINQQQNLSPVARGALVGGLNSGDYAQTKQVLESIEIKEGKIYFGGEELTGTNAEMSSFIKALKTASKVLEFIGKDSAQGSKPVQKAIEEAFGIQTVDTQRAEIANQYYSQVASLSTSGIFSDSQLMNLTRDGLKLADAQKILDEVKNRDGLTNYQSVIETLQSQGATPGEVKEVLNKLGQLEQTFVDALALDPKGSTRVKLGTVGEEEYNQTIGKLDQISQLAFEASQQMGLQYYDGNIDNFESAIKEIKPAFVENVAQLRSLEQQLAQIAQQRLLVSEELQRTDLTKEQRTQLTGIATALDDEFKTKYREKKVAGQDLTESYQFFKTADEQLTLLAEKIRASDFSQEIKDATLGQIETTRAKSITIGLDLLSQYEDLMALSGEEALEAAGKAITRALENFEKIAKLIDADTNKKLSDITAALSTFSSNTELAIKDFNKSVAGLEGDPVRIRAEQDLATATVNRDQSQKKLEAARKAKEDVDKNFEITLQKAAFSPIESLEKVEIARDKQIEAQNILSQAEEEYANNVTAQTEARLNLRAVEAQIPVRVSQFNSKQRNNTYKQQQLDRTLTENDVRGLQLKDEIGLIDIEIASTATNLRAIAKDIEDGYITNISIANEKIDELSKSQQDLISNRLDKLLEKENLEREQSIKLLENQSSLSAKYFDIAINGYESLNKETEKYSKQLDNLTQVGEQLKSLSQTQFQVKIGKQENQLSIVDAGVAARERLSSEELSPRQQAFQQRRLGAIQQLGNQSYGVNPAVFSSNEDTALAEQQKIATQLAKDKLEAMEKEQAIAAKLLQIELQRNQVAAEMAVREAEIGKIRAEQATIQAQFQLQQALLGTDQTAIKLAELEVQIAASQQGVADAQLGSAKENLALQALFAQLQKETFNLESASSRDGLITEIAGNENVDLASILQSLKNFKNFDPNKANPREVFGPYLEWLNKQTPQRDPNTPIGLPLEAFNGDIQAWMDANVAIAKQEQEQAKASAPPEIQSLKDVFDKVFGAPVADKIDMSNGEVKDIAKEIAILNAGRLGEKVAPTQEMIDSVAGQRDINKALDQARRLAQATEPVDNSRMASDVYAISTEMAEAMPIFLTIQELLGTIALNTSAEDKATPPDIGAGGNAYEDVKALIDKLSSIVKLREILAPIVNESNSNGPRVIPTNTPILGNDNLSQPKSNTLDLTDSILPPPQGTSTRIDQQSTLPATPAAKVSAILNPTIQNSLNPRFSSPEVNVSTVAQREPGYFYRNLASEVSPRVAYRVPPGIQATQGATSYQPVAQNTTINITNKIDAASQREMYAKIGEAQTKSILSALNQMA